MRFENQVARVANRLIQEYFHAVEQNQFVVRSMVFAYNWANSPSRQMTDREHAFCAILKAFMEKRLNNYHGWEEDENGRLVLT